MSKIPSELLHTAVHNPHSSGFCCLDCLLKDNIDAPHPNLYLFKGTYLCSKHVRDRHDHTVLDKIISIHADGRTYEE